MASGPHAAWIAFTLATTLTPALAATRERAERITLPQSFVEADPGYVVHGASLDAAFLPGALRWTLRDGASGARTIVDVTLLGARADATPRAERPLPGRITTFRGPREAWRTRRTFAAVRYDDAWPGIDALFEAEGQVIKGTWTVAPGADPGCIRLRHTGADDVRIAADGSLVVRTPSGELVDQAPLAWQFVAGERVDVAVAFALEARGGGAFDVSFDVGEHDPTRALFIDPAVLVQAGFLGGSADDSVVEVVVGDDGSVYVAGNTKSADFPAVVGPELVHDGPFGSSYTDGYVARLDPTGTTLLYAGFLGGTQHDVIYDIDVDAAGHLFIQGTTNSSETQGFPSTGQPAQHSGNYDAFVARLSPDGSSLDYCGYIGGNSDDRGFAMDVDPSGRMVVVGRFQSLQHTLPLVTGPYLSEGGDSHDGFIARVSADGNGLEYCGYLAGDNDDDITEVVCDPAGGAWFSGFSWSTDFPLVGGLGPGDSSIEAVLGRVHPDGTHLTASGRYGSPMSEYPQQLHRDAAGFLYVSGLTFGATSFPATVGPELVPAGTKDGYIAKFTPDGASMVWAGFTGTGKSAPILHDGEHVWVLADADGADPWFGRVAADGSSYELQASVSTSPDTTLWSFAKVPDALAPGVDEFWALGWGADDETVFPASGSYDVTANGGDDALLLRIQVADDPWTDLGFALAGTLGDPQQTATGTLGPLAPFGIQLTNTVANQLAWFVFGVFALNAPFKGGVMVPDPAPPGFALPLFTSVTGEVAFDAVWPAGVPAGTHVYVQWWIPDVAGPLGFAASNALQGVTP